MILVLLEVYTDVHKEPTLWLLSEKTLTYVTVNVEDGTHLDSLWGDHHQN